MSWLAVTATGMSGLFASAATAAPQPFACYYNPTSPCYSATGYGGSIEDINPVEYVVGQGGSGSIAYANNDNGGTVSAHTQGSFIDEYQNSRSYRAVAQLRHYIEVESTPGAPVDALVGLRITAFAAQLNLGGSGVASYTASQLGIPLVGREVFASPFMPQQLFDINQVVYVRPDVPIQIFMLAISEGNNSVLVDPVYEIVGSYANQYTLTGLLSGGAGAAVPEPAGWAMMILGFGAIGMALRRRHATVRAEPSA